MTRRFSRTAARVSCFLVVAGLWSCRENTILGTDLIPAGDSINTVSVPDTLTVLARSVYDDSLVTSYTKLQSSTGRFLGTTYQSAGSVTNDPFFGRTHSVLYFQPASNVTSFEFGTAPVIDSAVLVLPYGGIAWGDTLSAPSMRLRVYQMADTLVRDTFYYSNQRVAVNRSAKFGEKDVYFRDLTDSVFADGANRPPHLRMRLDTAVLMPALRSAIAAGSTIPDFVRTFKGLCIEPDTNRVSSFLPYFQFSGGADNYTRPGIVVYYRNAANPAGTTVPFYFQTAYGNAYTYIKRGYAGTPAYSYLFGNPDPNILLLQNEPGAAIDVQLPYVKNLPRTVYNKAELVLTSIDTASSAQFFIPSRVFPYKVSDDGTIGPIADRLPESSNEPTDFIGGLSRSVTIGGVTVTQYVINFPREMQQAVSAGRTLHLRINGTTSLPAAYRLIAGGRSHPQWGLKLNVTYSKQN